MPQTGRTDDGKLGGMPEYMDRRTEATVEQGFETGHNAVKWLWSAKPYSYAIVMTGVLTKAAS